MHQPDPGPHDAFDIARDLIAIESITGNEERVAAYLEGLLGRMGLATRSQGVGPGRRNILAGPERPAVVFCTHMDTVPPFVPLREDIEHLHGRGACDTKGIIASMLAAGARLLSEGRRDFGYLFVVGEEVDNAGAIAANALVRADWVIVGEPTENRVALGHKGVLRVEAHVSGRACHSAYPEEGDSAIHRLVRGLERVLATDWGRDPVLGPGTVNLGAIEGGVAANILAPTAAATILVRLVGPPEEALERIRAAFTDPATGAVDARVQLEEVKRMSPPRLEAVEGYPTTVVAYGTDAPFLEDVGKVVLFGPGSIRDAHTLEEKISKRSMIEAIDAYADLARRLPRGAGSRSTEESRSSGRSA